LNEGRLASDLKARREHLAFHGVANTKELIEKYTSSLSPDVVHGEVAQITRTYVALLKIMLLRLEPGELPARFERLGEFMTNQIGAILGLERFAAILHWVAPERFARMITPLQRGARSDRALEKARSTAWDIYLGRMPEQLGRFVSPVEGPAEGTCNLYYLATAETALAAFLGHRSIELLVQHVDSTASSIVVGHKSGLLEELLSQEELAELSDTSLEWERRAVQTSHLRSPVSGTTLEGIVSESEGAVARACER
jgi:hypothetical protein